MAEKLKFICRKRKQKTSEDVTWINADRMPYYNPAMISLYASGESVKQPGYSSKRYLPMVYWSVEYICEGEFLITRGENRYRLTAGDLLILHPDGIYSRANPGNVPVPSPTPFHCGRRVCASCPRRLRRRRSRADAPS